MQRENKLKRKINWKIKNMKRDQTEREKKREKKIKKEEIENPEREI